MTKTSLGFRVLVIVICLIFVIWNLYTSSTPVKKPSLVGGGFFILSVRVQLPGHLALPGLDETALIL